MQSNNSHRMPFELCQKPHQLSATIVLLKAKPRWVLFTRILPTRPSWQRRRSTERASQAETKAKVPQLDVYDYV